MRSIVSSERLVTSHLVHDLARTGPRNGQAVYYAPGVPKPYGEDWLGTEDSNPDLLIQSQLSYH